MKSAAQQRGDGLIELFPHNVPKCDINRSQCIDVKTSRVATHAHQVIEFVVQ